MSAIPVLVDGRRARVLGGRQVPLVVETRAHAPEDVAWATPVFALDEDTWLAMERGTFAQRPSAWR